MVINAKIRGFGCMAWRANLKFVLASLNSKLEATSLVIHFERALRQPPNEGDVSERWQ